MSLTLGTFREAVNEPNLFGEEFCIQSIHGVEHSQIPFFLSPVSKACSTPYCCAPPDLLLPLTRLMTGASCTSR
jgi:hypothetical protein